MMVTVFCASSTKAVVAELSVTADKTVAIVNGHHIKASELDVYMVVSQLPLSLIHI